MVILIKSDYSDMFAELDRVASMPTPKMKAGLDFVLNTGFETSRGLVHVQTGRLKASGHKESTTKASVWTGQFSFDAENNDGDPYGEYELARGGPHNFFANTPILKELFRIALVKGLHRR
jgi:hypothetical protein